MIDQESLPIIGHLAYFLVTISFIVRKIFWLRVISITASTVSIIYNSLLEPSLFIPVFWNALFTLINLYHITLIVIERRNTHLNNEERKIYNQFFNSIDVFKFKKILSCGKIENFCTGQLIIKERSNPESLFLILEGEMAVKLSDVTVSIITPFHFIGEMSFITGKKANADVFCSSNCRVLKLNKKKLVALTQSNQEYEKAISRALSSQLVEYVTNNNNAIAKAV